LPAIPDPSAISLGASGPSGSQQRSTGKLQANYRHSTGKLQAVFTTAPSSLLRLFFVSPSSLLRLFFVSSSSLLRLFFVSPSSLLRYLFDTCSVATEHVSKQTRRSPEQTARKYIAVAVFYSRSTYIAPNTIKTLYSIACQGY